MKKYFWILGIFLILTLNISIDKALASDADFLTEDLFTDANQDAAYNYYRKVNAYFYGTFGRSATSEELAEWSAVLRDNTGSVWKPQGAGLQHYLSDAMGWGFAPLDRNTATSMVSVIFENLFGALDDIDPRLTNYYINALIEGSVRPRGTVNAILNDLKIMPRVDGSYGQPNGWTGGVTIKDLLTSEQFQRYRERVESNVQTLKMMKNATGASASVDGLSEAKGAARYFKVTVPDGVTNLVIQTAGEGGDPNLYVERGSKPTIGPSANSSYCASTNTGTREQCTYATPLTGDYYILVYAASAYVNLTLTVSWTNGQDPEIEILTGYFRDSAVKGLDYASCRSSSSEDCLTGTTGADGDFNYRNGDTVTFNLGNLILGSASAAPLLTPTTVSEYSTQLAQFLQTLDDDLDPSNGINISEDIKLVAIRQSLVRPGEEKFDVNQNRLQEIVTVLAPGRTLISESDALNHSAISLHLLELSETDLGQWILGKKRQPEHYNIEKLNSSVRDRLRLYAWQKIRSGLQAKSNEFSENVTLTDLKRARVAAVIDIAKGFVDVSLATKRITSLPIGKQPFTEKELAFSAINGIIIINAGGMKYAEVDVDAYSDGSKSIIALLGGNWSGASKDGIKSAITFADLDSEITTSIIDGFWPLGESAIRGIFKKLDPTYYWDLFWEESALIAKAVNDSSASIKLYKNRKVQNTYIAVIDYLNAYYQQAGDSFRIANVLGAGYLIGNLSTGAAYGAMWQRENNLNKDLFYGLLDKTMKDVEDVYSIYAEHLGASNADVYARLDGTGKITCNGATGLLAIYLFADSALTKNSVDDAFVVDRIDWSIPDGVILSDVSSSRTYGVGSAKIVFDESGYKYVGANVYGLYNNSSSAALGVYPVLVKPCVLPNNNIVGGRWEFDRITSYDEDDDPLGYSAAVYRAVPDKGYYFSHWADVNGNVVAASKNITPLFMFNENRIRISEHATVNDGLPLRPVFGLLPILNKPIPGDAKVALNWTRVDGAIGYEVYFSDKVFFNGYDVLKMASCYVKPVYNGNSFTIVNGLKNGQIYYFSVTPVFDGGEIRASAFSNIVSATPTGTTTFDPIHMMHCDNYFAPPRSFSAIEYSVEKNNTLESDRLIAYYLSLLNLAPENATSHSPRFDVTGNRVLFLSRATNLVPGEQNAAQQLYQVDLDTGLIRRLSETLDGKPANGDISQLELAADAGKVVFRSEAHNLESGPGLYLQDLETGLREGLVLAREEQPTDFQAQRPAIDINASLLAYDRPDLDGQRQVHTLDLATRLERQETPLDGSTFSACCARISSDGRYLAWRETDIDGRIKLRLLDEATGKDTLIDWPHGVSTDLESVQVEFREAGREIWWTPVDLIPGKQELLHKRLNPVFVELD